RQTELGAHPVAQGAGEGVDAVLEPLRRDLLGGPVGLHAFGQRAGAAQRLVEPAVRLPVHLGITLGDVDVEVGLDLLDEPDGFAGEFAAGAGQRPQVGGQIVGPGLFQTVDPGQFGQQPFGLAGQTGRIRGRLVGHLGAQLRIAGEGVDVTVLHPVEPQPEQQIFTDEAGRGGAVVDTRIHVHNRRCKTEVMARLNEPSPYVEFDRTQWRALRKSTPLKLTEEEVVKLRGLGEKLDLLEVEEVYLPLARLIHLQVAARQRLFAATAEFLGESDQNPDRPVPFIIGVAGSVAVGKSTTARVLQALLARWGNHARVDLVTTDGFLYPNAELSRRNIMHRKGFPESYDRRALMRFVTTVKSGSELACAPVYSHLLYDIIP